MNVFDAVILSVVEGLTEFLPISSTGHLILASSLLGLPDSEFLKSFEIIIQSGAIAAVIALYWKSFFDVEILKRLVVAFIPTAVIGLLLYSTIKTYLLGSEQLVVWTLLLGGIALIAFEYFHHETDSATGAVSAISYTQSVLIGLFQSIAMIPGISRSGATIIGGLALGLKRKTIVEFSFLLAVPTMLAATGLDLLKNYSTFSSDQAMSLSIGFVLSFVVAAASIMWLLRFVQSHSFISFGIYRIALGLIFLFFVF
ncbi:MAG: undecaprenyl-diphosphatase [Parcubacteria group bacterium Gr01-1014_8]|nr:MAG: undecaprenyl-diphosphatase [Parcubacteria group bacterium Gr01-1014_8]